MENKITFLEYSHFTTLDDRCKFCQLLPKKKKTLATTTLQIWSRKKFHFSDELRRQPYWRSNNSQNIKNGIYFNAGLCT